MRTRCRAASRRMWTRTLDAQNPARRFRREPMARCIGGRCYCRCRPRAAATGYLAPFGSSALHPRQTETNSRTSRRWISEVRLDPKRDGCSGIHVAWQAHIRRLCQLGMRPAIYRGRMERLGTGIPSGNLQGLPVHEGWSGVHRREANTLSKSKHPIPDIATDRGITLGGNVGEVRTAYGRLTLVGAERWQSSNGLMFVESSRRSPPSNSAEDVKIKIGTCGAFKARVNGPVGDCGSRRTAPSARECRLDSQPEAVQ